MSNFFKKIGLLFFTFLLFIFGIFFFFILEKTSEEKNKEPQYRQQKNLIVIYSKSTCIYCLRAKNYLKEKSLEFKEIELSQNPEAVEELKKLTKRFTVPQIFIGETHIGGYSDLIQLSDEELNELVYMSE